jgi:hypothetical protein
LRSVPSGWLLVEEPIAPIFPDAVDILVDPLLKAAPAPELPSLFRSGREAWPTRPSQIAHGHFAYRLPKDVGQTKQARLK